MIKIATAHIMELRRMAGHNYIEDQSAAPLKEGTKHCSEVDVTESKT